MPAIGSLDGVGRGLQVFVVQEGQGLVEVGGLELGQNPAQVFEPGEFGAKLGELGLGGIGPATAVKEPVDFVHQFAEGPDVGMPARQTSKDALL